VRRPNLIDLHLHTTASDGALTPADLVARIAAAGLTIFAITDHDTTAGLREARTAAARLGLRFIDGIEITAVEDRRDVHILGYYINPDHAPLVEFLEIQRADRIRRVHEIAERLTTLGCTIDTRAILDSVARGDGRSVGRPQIANALVRAGHAVDRDDAFEKYLGEGGAAFVPRRGPAAAEVVRVIQDAGGLASLAHPGLTRRDDLIPALAAAGLGALEARHSDHDAAAESRYRALAAAHGLAVSGGSDYHGEISHRAQCLGTVVLAAEDFAQLEARAAASRVRLA
jgi:predicted metal-dependent phosphoesterase TrpH